MSNRAGLRSPASAASRMHVASNFLFDCTCCSGDNELHAKSSATCMLLTVSGLKCLPSAAMSAPKEQCEFLTLPEGPLRVCPIPDQRRGFFTPSSWTQVLCPLSVKSGHQGRLKQFIK